MESDVTVNVYYGPLSDGDTGYQTDDSDEGGDCFIATANYGSMVEPQVAILREFRDQYMMNNSTGRTFAKLHYTYLPSIANIIANHDSLCFVVRWSLTPIVGLNWAFINFGPITTMGLMLIPIPCISGFPGYRKSLMEY